MLNQWQRALAQVSLCGAICIFISGCFTELREDPQCFQDGERLETVAERVENGADSNICCDPNDNGNGFCIGAYENIGAAAAVLASCIPDNRGRGVCDLVCEEEECECLNNRDCGGNPDEVDGALCRANEGKACELEGLGSDRCTVCERCKTDDDCTEAGRGVCGAGVCVECIQADQCGFGQVCTDFQCVPERCEPGDDGDGACRLFFMNEMAASGINTLGECVPDGDDGICRLDCESEGGTNDCGCFQDSECDGTDTCKFIRNGVCGLNGASTEPCSFCGHCLLDSECDGGLVCNISKNACAECNDNDDCEDGESCNEGICE